MNYNYTTIIIGKTTRELLKMKGKKGESYDKVISRLLKRLGEIEESSIE